MTTLRRSTTAVIALALLNACATPYREPAADEPGASLVFNSQEDSGAVMFHVYADHERCRDVQKHDEILAVRKGSDVEMRIPAGKDFSLSAEWSIYLVRCKRLFGTFHPEPGGQYRASFESDETHCALKVTREVTGQGWSRFEVEPTYRSRKSHLLQEGGGCEPEIR